MRLTASHGNAGSRGIALLSVLVALVILQATLALAFLISVRGQRASYSAVRVAQARGAAEAGLSVALAWTLPIEAVRLEELAPWGRGLVSGGAQYEVSVRAHIGRVVLIQSLGRERTGLAESRIAALAVRRPADVPIDAALILQGSVHATDLANLSGSDQPLRGWPLCGPLVPQPVPAWRRETGAEPLFERFPVGEWRLFAKPEWPASASIATPLPHVTGGFCRIRSSTNLGDPSAPSAPCAAYSPVVYHRGDLRVVGGRGRGLLIVDGSLSLEGGFVFHGLVLVRRALRVGGTGARVVGAVVAGSGPGDDHWLEGPLSVRYSRCLIQHALPGSLTVSPLTGRGYLPYF